MYLKCIEIDGFKSFADKIKLDFDMGITSIVGPNGSGKSNILDAILWVLGEQSYKNIRAKESSDVIFSGGKNKKPRSTATVSLYIDNEDKVLEIDDEIVKVTRKINKKSENEYYINDQRCRLKDINELFLDTGVGKSAYSVIGQGKVEKIISASNKEIKSIIEEAAGIKKIKLRKDEALKKLAKVELETDKINLIVNELEENKEKIGKQAEKAIKYKKLDDEINTLKKSIYLEEYQTNQKIVDDLSKQKHNSSLALKELEKQFTEKEATLEDVNNKRNLLSDEINTLTDKNINLKKDVDKLVNDKVLYGERIKGFNREICSKKENLGNLEGKLKDQITELDRLNSKKDVVLEELKTLEGDNLKYEKQIGDFELLQRDLEIEIGVQKEHVMDSEVGRLKLIAEIENSEKRTKSSANKIRGLDEEAVEYNKKIEKLTTELNLLETKQKNIQTEIKKIDDTIEDAEKQIDSLSQKMNTIYDERKEVAYNLSRQGAKLENLKKLEANNEGFFKGVKAVLNANIDGVDGAFLSLIDIPEHLETAIESSVGGSLQDIVVKDSGVAKKCISYLKQSNGGRASFLAFDSIKLNNSKKTISQDGVLGYASDLVGYNSIYNKPVEFVLGNLLVVKSTDVALKISKENLHRGNIVTLGGELISGRGRITGGQHIKSASSIIFERKKEIKKLDKIVGELDKKHKELDNSYDTHSKQMDEYEKKLENIDDLRVAKEDSYREILRNHTDLTDTYRKETKKLKVIEMEKVEETNYINEYNKQLKNATTQRFDVEAFLKKSKDRLADNNKKLISLKTEIELINKSYSNIKINYLNKKEQVKQLEREIQRNKGFLQEFQTENKKTGLEIEKLNSDIIKLDERLNNIQNEFHSENIRYEKEFLEIKEKKKLQEELETLEKKEILAVKNIEKDLILGENKIKILIEKLEKTINWVTQIEEKLAELVDIEEAPLESTVAESKEILYRLEARLKGLGLVNLLAIEEFTELTKKHEFITAQRDDLIVSKKALLKLVEDIEKIIETKFFTAYKEIDKNFEYMCKEVLNNSIGRLQLVDNENILESGIDLMVKFKNKKSQSITLLSGGEKSMVAIAFIMALFMYKPSPFTFFDEIEAALDETNIKKLISKLKEFTDRSQFILITHNKETMRRSDTLYGVTMNKELGESKIISVSV
ncbi:chromosome segregation protein SMC [Psychrilyobacter atlanticus]|uniref:chromosome segregation protein SMC n=1 Tax=Psychrilyobacter atlanticus TaxID=271091 RepID=UPI00040C67EC|nr:chromosome segregation protein SMC [Psychrilyobacter atlanticus]